METPKPPTPSPCDSPAPMASPQNPVTTSDRPSRAPSPSSPPNLTTDNQMHNAVEPPSGHLVPVPVGAAVGFPFGYYPGAHLSQLQAASSYSPEASSPSQGGSPAPAGGQLQPYYAINQQYWRSDSGEWYHFAMMRTQMDDLKKQLAEEKNNAMRRFIEFKREKTQIMELIREQTIELQRKEAEILSNTMRIQNFIEEETRLHGELDSSDRTIHEKDEKLKELEKLNEALKNAEQLAAENAEEVDKMKSELSKKETEIENLKKERDRLIAENKGLDTRIETLCFQNHEDRRAIIELKTQNRRLEASIEEGDKQVTPSKRVSFRAKSVMTPSKSLKREVAERVDDDNCKRTRSSKRYD